MSLDLSKLEAALREIYTLQAIEARISPSKCFMSLVVDREEYKKIRIWMKIMAILHKKELE